ncbi:MAG: hypothetical protein KDK70_41965 [Myxococcales bacterium]|nr:hypothetical protein [Myxococcales bacterium]
MNEVNSSADKISADIGARPGDVHMALIQLKEEGEFAGVPYIEGGGDFSVRLP